MAPQNEPRVYDCVSNLTKQFEHDEEAAAVGLFLEKVRSGSRLLANKQTEQPTDTDVAIFEARLSQAREDTPPNAKRATKLRELAKVLKEPAKKVSKQLQWYVRFASACVDIIRRDEGSSEKGGENEEYIRKRELSAVMLNDIISGVTPTFGVHSLALLPILAAAKFSWFAFGNRSTDKRQKAADLAVKGLLYFDLRAHHDNLWFHPAILISWFLGER